MSQSIHNQEDSLDNKILRDFHFHPPTINEEVHGELPKISSKAKIFIQSNLSKDHFFRFGVSGGGCSGFNYLMDEDTEIKDDDIILFKGSRGMKMEKIISGVFQNNVI